MGGKGRWGLGVLDKNCCVFLFFIEKCYFVQKPLLHAPKHVATIRVFN